MRSRSRVGKARRAHHLASVGTPLAHHTIATPELRHQFHMRRVAELIDWRDAFDLVAAIDQDFGVARECRDVAGNRDHHRNFARRKLRRLRLRALPWRVEDNRIVVAQFLRHQRAAEQVARLGLDRLQSRGRCCGLLQRRHRTGIAVEGGNPRFRRKPEREGTDAAEQIGDVFAALAMRGRERGEPLFTFYRCLQERSGRQRDLGRADRDDRRRSHQHQFAVACQPRQPVLFGNTR